ncbi:MAG: protein kinase [Planctomycetota bacterium]
MSWEDAFAPVDEEARKRFEQDVASGSEVRISEYLPERGSKLYAGTLEELVMIEMGHRWATAGDSGQQPPLIESYLTEYPDLKESESIGRLLEEELQVRLRYDSMPPLEEYEQRFPEIDLSDTFRKLALDTLAEETDQDESETQEFHPENRYSRVEKHASGGMGIVYRAIDEQIGREVALKHLRFNASEDHESYTRFVNEAKLAGALEHPGIVPVYELGQSEDGSPFYAMKLVEGGTLEDLIHEVHQSDPDTRLRELLSVLVSVANTIAFAHDRGVIHRDIKPANIVVGKFGETVILDWGLAKQVNSRELARGTEQPDSQSKDSQPDMQLTQIGTILGTPAYMAPEQAEGKTEKIDHRADIYALGAVLFQMLAGRPSIETQAEFDRLRFGKRLKPPSIHRKVPRALEAICLRAMQLDPTSRYDSAIEFAKDVDRYLADEPVSTYKDPFTTRLGRWARKHKSLVATSIAMMIAIAVASVAIAFERQAREEERKRKIATTQAVMDSNVEAAENEIREGRFENGLLYLSKAIEIVEKDASFSEPLQELRMKYDAAERLKRFQELCDRAEVLAWDEQDDDMIVLLQNALHMLNVFEHRDWWNHLTGFELKPEIEDQLRNRVYRELCMLVGIQLKKVAVEIGSADVLMAGGNERSNREFERALVPMNAAKRFRPGIGLDFATTFYEQQKAPGFINNGRLVAATLEILNYETFLNPTDRFFVGLCLVFYVDTLSWGGEEEHSIVSLTSNSLKMMEGVLGLESAQDAALGHLRSASVAEPFHFWTLFTHAWAAEHKGLYNEAIAIYTGCLAQKPSESRSYLNRSHDYMKLAEFTEGGERSRNRRQAMQDIQRGIHLSPGFIDLYRWRWDYEFSYEGSGTPLSGALACLDAMKHEAPSGDLEHNAFLRGFRANYVSNYVYRTNQFIEAQPELQEVWLASAFAYLLQGDLEKAKASLKEAQKRLAFESIDDHLIQGQIALMEEDWSAARRSFTQALELEESEYLAHRGLAIVTENTKSSGEALEAFLALRKRALNAWQEAESLMHISDHSVAIGAHEQALASVKSIIEIRPSDNCRYLLDRLEQRGEKDFLIRVNEILAERYIPPTQPLARPGEEAALMNGGFELSLDQYWFQGAERTSVWVNQGGCQATARSTLDFKHAGKYSLRIQNVASPQPDRRGSMQQSFPTDAGKIYKIKLWARTRNAKDNTPSVHIGSGKDKATQRILAIPAGTLDWTEYEGEFEADSNLSVLKIVSEDQGTVWLDELRVVLQVDAGKN